MSFKAEIEAIVGDIDSPDYTAEAVLYLKEGVKYVTKYAMTKTAKTLNLHCPLDSEHKVGITWLQTH